MTGCCCRFYWSNHIHCHTFESYILSWNWRYRYSVHHQTSCFQLAFFTRFAKFVYFSSHLLLLLVLCLLGRFKCLTSPFLSLLSLFFQLSISFHHHPVQHHLSWSSS